MKLKLMVNYLRLKLIQRMNFSMLLLMKNLTKLSSLKVNQATPLKKEHQERGKKAESLHHQSPEKSLQLKLKSVQKLKKARFV
tara:strand:+ start:10697 stop:10945 length:249 start_codon:yes stop_codon:yes gene_type:complete